MKKIAIYISIILIIFFTYPVFSVAEVNYDFGNVTTSYNEETKTLTVYSGKIYAVVDEDEEDPTDAWYKHDETANAHISSAETIVVESSVDYVGKYAFYNFRESLKSIVFTGKDKVYVCEDARCMFYVDSNLLEIRGISQLDTSSTTNMERMFGECPNLSSLDLSNFDTSKVTDMSRMFSYCSKLQQLEIGNFNTREVTDMNSMFDGCEKLQEFSIANFNTSRVTNMEFMFSDCLKLQSLNLSTFDTSRVANMRAMFQDCQNLKYLDVSSFNTSKVNNMGFMFSSCRKLESLDVRGFDTRNVTDMMCMFQSCVNLKTLEINNFNTSKVANMNRMFFHCEKLKELDTSRFDTSKVTDMEYMFAGCYELESLNLSNFDTSRVTNMEFMFYAPWSPNSNLVELNLSSFDFSSVVSSEAMALENNENMHLILDKKPLKNLEGFFVSGVGKLTFGDVSITSSDAGNIKFDKMENGEILAIIPNQSTVNIGGRDLIVSSDSAYIDIAGNLCMGPNTLNIKDTNGESLIETSVAGAMIYQENGNTTILSGQNVSNVRLNIADTTQIFLAEKSKYSEKDNDGNILKEIEVGEIDDSGLIKVTITDDLGMSTSFYVDKDSAITPQSSPTCIVDGVVYFTLQDAVNSVSDNGTIRLLKDNYENIKVQSRLTKFSIDSNGYRNNSVITTVDSKYKISKSTSGNITIYTIEINSGGGTSGGGGADSIDEKENEEQKEGLSEDSEKIEKSDPAKTSIKRLKAGKKSFIVTWRKKNVDGYQIQYSNSAGFKKKNKLKTIKGNKKSTIKISKLKSKKKYYVRIRTYKLDNKKKVYSLWSNKKSVKTK